MDCSRCPLQGEPRVPCSVPKVPKGIAIVGESPGYNEARVGKPFVGESGKVLNSLLQSLAISRDDLLVTNAVSCYPGSGDEKKRLLPIATECCRKRLQAELDAVQAKYVLAFGKLARDALWPDEHHLPVSETRGRWKKDGDRWILCAIHPAFYLRRPGDGRDLIDDVRKFFTFSPNEFVPTDVEMFIWQPNFQSHSDYPSCWKGASEAIERYRSYPVIAFDIETDGYDWRRNEILNLSMSGEPGKALVLCSHLLRNPLVAKALRELFSLLGITWVGHNAKFDVKFLLKHYLAAAPRNYEDTMLQHYCLDERPGTQGLKGIASRMFDMPDYEHDLVFRYLSKKSDSFAVVPPEKLAQYAGMDTDYTLRLYRQQTFMLEGRGLLEFPYRRVVLPAAHVLVDVEMHGIQIDARKASEVENLLTTEREELMHKLRIVSGHPELNPNSWQQLSKILYGEMALPQVRGRGFKEGSTCHAALTKLQERTKPSPPFLDLLLQYRKVTKLLSSYVLNLKDFVYEGRVNPTFNLIGTEIGRLSARNPAVQTIPRAYTPKGKLIRDMYVPTKGRILVHCDYRQAELCVFACFSKDPFLVEVYRDDRDLHSEVAVAMFGPDFTKEQRMQTKMFNFSYLYGGNEYSFAQDAGLPIDQARQWVQQYNEVMPVGYRWRQEMYGKLRSEGYIEYPTGRRRRLPFITKTNADDARKASVHAIVAGTASDLNLISMTRIHRLLLRSEAHILLNIHDAIIVECTDDDDVIARTVDTMCHTMIQVAKEIMGDIIPFRVDADVGYRWGSFVKYDDTWRERAGT